MEVGGKCLVEIYSVSKERSFENVNARDLETKVSGYRLILTLVSLYELG